MFADMNAYIIKESHCEVWGCRSAVAEDSVLHADRFLFAADRGWRRRHSDPWTRR